MKGTKQVKPADIRDFIIEKGWLSSVKSRQSAVDSQVGSRELMAGSRKSRRAGFSVRFLAAGEYNANYKIGTPAGDYVFRINYGSQIGQEDQAGYEYSCLKLLEGTGVTPKPFFYDPQGGALGHGIILEEFIRGRPLDYCRDLGHAARIFSKIHAVGENSTLLTVADPVKSVADESLSLLLKYPPAEFPVVRKELLEIYSHIAGSVTASLFSGESLCPVNTEVNSGNFIINGKDARLIDWEKAVFSYRYLDLAHFTAPTTTLWKTGFRFDEAGRRSFLKIYASDAMIDPDEVIERTGMMEKVILLRALSWCWMAYYEYLHIDRPIRNMKTFKRIRDYLGEMQWFLK